MGAKTKVTCVDSYTAIAQKLLALRNDVETLLKICKPPHLQRNDWIEY